MLLIIMTLSPMVALSLVSIAFKFDGSALAFLSAVQANPSGITEIWPKPSWTAFYILSIYFVFEFLLLIIVPGKVCDSLIIFPWFLLCFNTYRLGMDLLPLLANALCIISMALLAS